MKKVSKALVLAGICLGVVSSQIVSKEPFEVQPDGTVLFTSDIQMAKGKDINLTAIQGTKYKILSFEENKTVLSNPMNSHIYFKTQGAQVPRVVFDRNGKVGIGVTNPAAQLDIKSRGNNNLGGLALWDAQKSGSIRMWFDSGQRRHITGGDGRGDLYINGNSEAGNVIMSIGTSSKLGVGVTAATARLEVKAIEDDVNSGIVFRNKGNTGTIRVWFDANGKRHITGGDGRGDLFINGNGQHGNVVLSTGASSQVSIGTTTIPSDDDGNKYKLTVDGGIYATDLRIRPTVHADYVFKKDYNLMPLSELKTSIEKNQHLPGMPSEKEVLENGVSVAEMQNKLLEKVEELTLYILQQEERIKELESRLDS